MTAPGSAHASTHVAVTSEAWRVAHAFDASLPGWLVVMPRMQFSEAAGFSHLHLHVVPRMPDQPDDRRGPAVFG